MMRAQDWADDLTEFLKDYRYQPNLTAKLDALPTGPFDQELVNEIVLWKLNRYAPLEAGALTALNRIANIQPGNHRNAETELTLLLGQPGVDLPMASTLLRFRNPAAFQIIDVRAYRAVTGDDYPLYSTSGVNRKVSVYFTYLDDLVALSQEKGIVFKDLDRILYVFDKQKNGTL